MLDAGDSLASANEKLAAENERLREKLRNRKDEIERLRRRIDDLELERSDGGVDVEVKVQQFLEARERQMRVVELERERERLLAVAEEAKRRAREIENEREVEMAQGLNQQRLLLSAAKLFFEREFESVEELREHLSKAQAPVCMGNDRKWEVHELCRKIKKLRKRLVEAREEYSRALMQVKKQVKTDVASVQRQYEIMIVKEVADREECERQIEELKKRIPRKQRLVCVTVPQVSIVAPVVEKRGGDLEKEVEELRRENELKTLQIEGLEDERRRLRKDTISAITETKAGALMRKAKEKIVSQKHIITDLRRENEQLRGRLHHLLDSESMKDLKIARLESTIRYARPPIIQGDYDFPTHSFFVAQQGVAEPQHIVPDEPPHVFQAANQNAQRLEQAERTAAEYAALIKEISAATFGRPVPIETLLSNPDMKHALLNRDTPSDDQLRSTIKTMKHDVRQREETINEQQQEIDKLTSQITKLKKTVSALRKQLSPSQPLHETQSLNNYENLVHELQRKCRKQRRNIHDLVNT